MARATRSKTARLTWANKYEPFPVSLAAGVEVAYDLLGNALAFQSFDSTIVHVLGSLYWTGIQVAVGSSSADYGLHAHMYVADDSLAVGNFPKLDVATDQASYLWTYSREYRIARIVDGSLVDTADPSVQINEVIDVRALRRFRENNKTLWLHVKNVGIGTLLLGFWTRTLLRVP